MTEIAPSRIRGFLLIFYSAWYGIGQLCASLALKVSNDLRPMDYLTPIYTEWAMMVSPRPLPRLRLDGIAPLAEGTTLTRLRVS